VGDANRLDNFSASSDLYHSVGLPLYAASPHGEQNPTNTWTPSDLFDLSLGELIASETEEPINKVSGASTSVGQRIPISGSLHQIQEEGHLSDLGIRCSASSSHIAAINPLDWHFSFSSVPSLISTSQNVAALPNSSLAPENIHSGISFHEVASNTLTDATLVLQPFQGGFSVAATSTRQHLLPGDPASHENFPTPRTSRSSNHSLEGSTSTTAQPHPNPSGTTNLSTIQCTWAACSKTFLTRSEYK
jgi:hypothetical protein